MTTPMEMVAGEAVAGTAVDDEAEVIAEVGEVVGMGEDGNKNLMTVIWTL